MRTKLDPQLIQDLNHHAKTSGIRSTASVTGVSASTLRRALKSGEASKGAIAKLRRVPPRMRTAADFLLAPRVTAPRVRSAAASWKIETIRAAIELQMKGSFAYPKRLAEAMRRDDAIYTARSNRIAPVSAVSVEIQPHDSERGRNVAAKALASVQTPRTVLAGIEATLVDHGVAIGYVEHEVNAAGTLIDMRLTEWPIEHVRANEATGQLETVTDTGETVVITHGDGRWIVFRQFATTPWREAACLLPAALIWAAHAEGVSDWASSSRAHGLAKILGTLPEGAAINDADGDLTPAAQQFVEMIEALAEGESPAGLKPFGSEAVFLANGSTAWQVFAENIVSREKAAARVYLGTDAMLGSVGGAPGVDISALFGVATTKIQGDFDAIQNGLASGLFEPWAAVNFGDTRYAPRFVFLMPDPDEERKREQRSAARMRLNETIKSMREQRLEVTQETVNVLAHEYGVRPAPVLASPDKQTTSVMLDPTDIAKVVRVREARASQGLPPFGDARDDMTLTQLDASVKAEAEA